MLDKDKVLEIQNEFPSHLWLKLKTYHVETYNYIDGEFDGKNFSEKAYQYVYGKESQTCNLSGCDEQCSFRRFSNGYQKYCSYECSGIAKENKVKNKCEICDQEFVTVASRSRRFCGGKCRKQYMKTDEYKEKIVEAQREYVQDEYGVDYYFQTEKFKDKAKQTKKERYGDENYVNVEKARETKDTKYGDPNYNNLEKARKTKKELYGDENYNNREKFRRTLKKKCGVDHHFKHNDFLEKRRKTCINKYGVEYPSKNTDVKEKIKETVIEKYGVESTLQLPRARKRLYEHLKKCGFGTDWFQARMKELYGVSNYGMTEEHTEQIRKFHYEKMYDKLLNTEEFSELIEPLFDFNDYSGTIGYEKYPFKCKKCDVEFVDYLNNNHIPRCPECFPKMCVESNAERELYEFINSILDCEIIRNDRSILDGKEVDIYVPEKNIAVEFDGIYWHSQITGGKNKKYHLQKTEQCEEQGIKLIHIFENEWVFKQDIVKQRLKHIFNVSDRPTFYARNCEVREIDNKAKFVFLNQHHIQGSGRSKVKLGLFHENRLVGVMTFGSPSISQGHRKRAAWEIKRFALSASVLGAAGKLFKHFVREFEPDRVITYADRRWSSKFNNVYDKIGFEFNGTTQSNYFYFKNTLQLEHRFNYRKNVLSEKLDKFDSELTEWENMQLNGYDRIWDCGHLKYEWTNNC